MLVLIAIVNIYDSIGKETEHKRRSVMGFLGFKSKAEKEAEQKKACDELLVRLKDKNYMPSMPEQHHMEFCDYCGRDPNVQEFRKDPFCRG